MNDWNVVLPILLKIYGGASVEETEFEDLSEMPKVGRDIILHFERADDEKYERIQTLIESSKYKFMGSCTLVSHIKYLGDTHNKSGRKNPKIFLPVLKWKDSSYLTNGKMKTLLKDHLKE